MRRVTIDDLARAAGVSKPTVSRALNDHPDVSPATKERVLRLAAELGYVPSMSAKALRTGRFKMLGLLVPRAAWAWMPEVIRGVTEEADRRGYTLVLQPLDESAERRFVEKALPVLPIDGLVLVIPPGLVEDIGALHRGGLPVVAIDDQVQRPEFPSVEITNRESVTRLTRHLMETGRRRIAFASAGISMVSMRDRLYGYRDALDGLPELVVTSAGLDNRAVAADLMARRGEFDAVVCAYDELAFEVMRELRGSGVAVAGFDDVPAAAVTGLTTVRSPFYEMGTTAVHMLISSIEGEASPERVVLPAELVIRESTRKGV